MGSGFSGLAAAAASGGGALVIVINEQVDEGGDGANKASARPAQSSAEATANALVDLLRDKPLEAQEATLQLLFHAIHTHLGAAPKRDLLVDILSRLTAHPALYAPDMVVTAICGMTGAFDGDDARVTVRSLFVSPCVFLLFVTAVCVMAW